VLQFTCNKIRERNNMNIIENIKALFAKPETVKSVKVLYAPAKSEEKTLAGLNLYTVEVTEPLFTKGKKSGFIGKVRERENQIRAFRFDRIRSLVEA
jgi:phosphoribosyl-AMP cyclohydrolase